MAKKGLRAWVKEKWVDIGAPDGKGGYNATEKLAPFSHDSAANSSTAAW